MARKLTKKEREIYRKYHIPSTSNLNSIKVNAVFFRSSNTKEHELEKAKICFELLQEGKAFITEAERSYKKGEARKIADIVDLTSGDEIEIVHKHESHKEIKAYRENGVIAICVGDTFICKKCLDKYNKHLKRHEELNICDNCYENV